MSQQEPFSIAVVVPAKDAGETIGPCLDGLTKAGFVPSDIVVVDDGSRDGTGDIAAATGVTLIRHERPQGAAGARNSGARATNAALLIFVDADVVVHPDIRSRILSHFDADPDLAALFGSYDTVPAAPGRVSRIRNLLHHYVHHTAPREAVTFWTGLGAVRRDAFEQAGGFDISVDYMEDIAFGYALYQNGRPILLDPAIQGTHLKHWSLLGFMRTDLFHRAIPWSRLLLANAVPASLNAGLRGKASVLTVGATFFAAVAGFFQPLAALLACLVLLLILAALNAGFLRFLARLNGPLEAVAGLGVLWLHYLMAGLGFGWVLVSGDRD